MTERGGGARQPGAPAGTAGAGDAGGAEASGAAEAPVADRPLGLSLLIWLLWFWVGAIVLVFLGIGIGDGPVMLSGRAVPRPEALAAVVPVLTPMGLAAAGAALALGLGKPWARPAVMLPFVLAAAAPAFTGTAYSPIDLLAGALILLPVLGALVWYLYFTPGVRAHFDRLRRAASDGPPERPA